MTGTGAAAMHGAITIINATSTGRGAALAVRGGVEATWTQTQGTGLEWGTPAVDSNLAESVHAILRDEYGASPGAHVRTESAFPPARGLKTSSGAAAAMFLAGAQAAGVPLTTERLIKRSVEASMAAGVTITGAFDDQVAVVHGGCHLTDNVAGRILHQIPMEPWHVAIWVPDESVSKSLAAGIDATSISKSIRHAESLLLDGDIPGAMTVNGNAFSALYAEAGLPISFEPADIAMEHGAIGAGLSGTGPAVAALFEAPCELPEAAGGAWHWTQAVA